MEYNYTKEWKQPNKVYRIGAVDFTPFFSEGIKLSVLILIALTIVFFFLIGFMAMAKGLTFVGSILKNGYLIIALLIALIVWLFATLKYDNKSFIRYVLSHLTYRQKKKTSIEHEDKVVYMEEPIYYSKIKTSRRKQF